LADLELRNRENADYIITVSHVPPFNPTEFGEASVQCYTQLLRATPNLILSLHGHVHEHRDLYPYDDGVRYMTSFSYQQSAFVLLKIVKGKVQKTIINY
jgi:2',3'-cyclic-nucleotide 2'-phosphodiesterase (5'-nucleotidase family)